MKARLSVPGSSVRTHPRPKYLSVCASRPTMVKVKAKADAGKVATPEKVSGEWHCGGQGGSQLPVPQLPSLG